MRLFPNPLDQGGYIHEAMAILAVGLLSLIAASSAVPLGKQKTFGHAIKNGVLAPNTDVTTFEHTCGVSPCVITHVNVPSIYPKGGDAWNWTEGRALQNLVKGLSIDSMLVLGGVGAYWR